ncbi:MAG: ATP-binding protein [bacterium]|nr:ATP-binding protein [bacterium]
MELEWDEDSLNQISIAIIEAVSNAIEHGNKFKADYRVLVEARLSSTGMHFSVSDEGGGFNRELLTSPPISPDDERFLNSRGRGIFIMRDVMDVVDTFTDDSGRFTLKLGKTLTS